MTGQKSSFIYPRLCIAYFLEFAIWGCWSGALAHYAYSALGMSGGQIGLLYAAMPIGAIISPLFIGPLADRYFAAQKVVAALHLLGAICLFLAGLLCLTGQATFPLLMALMLLQGACYAPTIGLVNTIVFKHMPSPTMGPYVFIFGSLGWICVNLIIAAFLGGADKPYFLFVSGICSVLLALYVGTLPDTPPKGAPAPGEKSDTLGLGALTMLRDPAFLVFVILAFLVSIPACNYFFPAQITFMTERGYPSPVGLSTLNQFADILLMAALPFLIRRIGLKGVLLIGMSAWGIRYLFFAQPSFALTIIGLCLHGFCYSHLYVASYMYAELKAPQHLKASAQGLMIFLMIGVGQVLGSLSYGTILERNPPMMTAMTSYVVPNVDEAKRELVTLLGSYECSECKHDLTQGPAKPLPPWNDAKMENSSWRYLDLARTAAEWTGGKGAEESQHTLGTDVAKTRDNVITQADLEAMPDTLTYGDVTYTREELQAAFAEVRNLLGKSPGADITRDEWLSVQAHNWYNIWMTPVIWVALCFAGFLFLGQNPKNEKQE